MLLFKSTLPVWRAPLYVKVSVDAAPVTDKECASGPIRVSIGIAETDAQTTSWQELLAKALKAWRSDSNAMLTSSEKLVTLGTTSRQLVESHSHIPDQVVDRIRKVLQR